MAKSSNGIVLNQHKYALQLISGCGLSNVATCATPMEHGLKLTSIEYNRALNTNTYRAKKQNMVSRSITEVEYRSMALDVT